MLLAVAVLPFVFIMLLGTRIGCLINLAQELAVNVKAGLNIIAN
jgi:hypothetical protein